MARRCSSCSLPMHEAGDRWVHRECVEADEQAWKRRVSEALREWDPNDITSILAGMHEMHREDVIEALEMIAEERDAAHDEVDSLQTELARIEHEMRARHKEAREAAEEMDWHGEFEAGRERGLVEALRILGVCRILKPGAPNPQEAS